MTGGDPCTVATASSCCSKQCINIDPQTGNGMCAFCSFTGFCGSGADCCTGICNFTKECSDIPEVLDSKACCADDEKGLACGVVGPLPEDGQPDALNCCKDTVGASCSVPEDCCTATMGEFGPTITLLTCGEDKNAAAHSMNLWDLAHLVLLI